MPPRPPRLQLLHALQQLGGGLLVVFGAGAHVFAHERGGGGRHGFRAAQAQLRLQGRMRLRGRLQRGQQRQRAGVVIQRFFQPPQRQQDVAQVVLQDGVIGLHLRGLLQPAQRLLQLAQMLVGQALLEQDADVGSGRRHGRHESWARKAKGADANQWPRTGQDVFFSADLRFF